MMRIGLPQLDLRGAAARAMGAGGGTPTPTPAPVPDYDETQAAASSMTITPVENQFYQIYVTDGTDDVWSDDLGDGHPIAAVDGAITLQAATFGLANITRAALFTNEVEPATTGAFAGTVGFVNLFNSQGGVQAGIARPSGVTRGAVNSTSPNISPAHQGTTIGVIGGNTKYFPCEDPKIRRLDAAYALEAETAAGWETTLATGGAHIGAPGFVTWGSNHYVVGATEHWTGAAGRRHGLCFLDATAATPIPLIKQLVTFDPLNANDTDIPDYTQEWSGVIIDPTNNMIGITDYVNGGMLYRLPLDDIMALVENGGATIERMPTNLWLDPIDYGDNGQYEDCEGGAAFPDGSAWVLSCKRVGGAGVNLFLDPNTGEVLHEQFMATTQAGYGGCLIRGSELGQCSDTGGNSIIDFSTIPVFNTVPGSSALTAAGMTLNGARGYKYPDSGLPSVFTVGKRFRFDIPSGGASIFNGTTFLDNHAASTNYRTLVTTGPAARARVNSGTLSNSAAFAPGVKANWAFKYNHAAALQRSYMNGAENTEQTVATPTLWTAAWRLGMSSNPTNLTDPGTANSTAATGLMAFDWRVDAYVAKAGIDAIFANLGVLTTATNALDASAKVAFLA